MIEDYLILARSGLNEIVKKALFDVYSDDFIEIKKVLERISIKSPTKDIILNEYADTIKNNCEFITINDNFYPQELKQIPSAPIVLSVKGSKQIFKKNIVAVAGTREPDIEDFSSIRAIIGAICDCGLAVVSGLARGTDCVAHIQSVKHGTIAVMAHGLHMCYPKEHQLLMDKIIANQGIIVSEYAFHQTPNKLNFAKRNRIMVGMSNSTIILRARKKISGTMISAKYARGFAKHIYTINPCGENAGNVYLLQSKIATQIEDIKTFRYQLMMDCLKKQDENKIINNTQTLQHLYQNKLDDDIIDDFEIAKKELPDIIMSAGIQKISENNFSKALSICKNNTNFSDKNIKQFLLEKLIDSKTSC